MYQILPTLTSLECQDPRDMIYATLSFVDWSKTSRILPDYKKSCFELAADVLRVCAGEEDTMLPTTTFLLVEIVAAKFRSCRY